MIPVLIDTDPGIDDALALLLAWGSPEIAVQAITTVAGNVPVEQASRNAWRLSALRGPTPAPVLAQGAASPLRGALRTATDYHGQDGLGDVEGWPVAPPRPAPAAAVDVLLEHARRDAERLVVIALGPLTNLALALAREAEALRRVGRVVAMGGAVGVPGNVTPEAEFNLYVDPEAARVVVEAGLALELVPLDATRQAVLPRSDFDAMLARRPGPVADRLRVLTARAFTERGGTGEPGLTLHDPLAVGAAVDPSLVTWEPVRLSVEASGRTRRTPGPPNCRIAARVDRQRFMALFLDRCCPGLS